MTVDINAGEHKEMSIHVRAPYSRLGNWERYDVSLANVTCQIDTGGDKLAKKLGLDEAIHIIIPESNTWYIIYPKIRAYAIVDELPGMAVSEERPPKIEKKAVGEEEIGDWLCAKYQAHVQSFSGDFDGSLWEAKGLNGLPIREVIVDQGASLETVLSDVKLEKPPLTAFEPPADYKRYTGKEFVDMIQTKIRQIPLKKSLV
jgi:hypothetical protein